MLLLYEKWKLLFSMQRIFREYKQPFSLTYLGLSLMVVYLPIAALKDRICSSLGTSTALHIRLRINELHHSAETDITSSLITDTDLSNREEGRPVMDKNGVDEPHFLAKSNQLRPWEIAKCGLILTPAWFVTEVTLRCSVIYLPRFCTSD